MTHLSVMLNFDSASRILTNSESKARTNVLEFGMMCFFPLVLNSE